VSGPGAGRLTYFDASAFVKLVVPERESRALIEALDPSTVWVSAAVIEVEVVRAVRRVDPRAVEAARYQLARLRLLRPTDAIRRRAGELDPPELHSLDAVHLASALAVAPVLGAFYSYEARLQEAAETAGLPVRAPA
jgi:predicted nucleic acid-binding protein